MTATWEIRQGDALARLAEMPDNSVHCCVTSPPYYGLRDYGTGTWEGGDEGCDHVKGEIRTGLGLADWSAEHARGGAHKAGEVDKVQFAAECGKCGARRVDEQIGLEDTLDEFLDRLLTVFAEVRRVLRPDGTLWVNIGDSYAAKPRGSDNGWDKSRLSNPARIQKEQAASLHRSRRSTGEGVKEKDLMMVPALLALALRAQGWWLRSEIIWHKRTAMPESVGDRPSKAHEQVYLLANSARYFYDGEAIREPLADKTLTTWGTSREAQEDETGMVKTARYGNAVPDRKPRVDGNGVPVGGNKRTVWPIASKPFPEAHFATFPPALVEPMILAGTSAAGCCGECGAPWRRIVESTRLLDGEPGPAGTWQKGDPLERGAGPGAQGAGHWRHTTDRNTIGWEPGCDHQAEPVPCTVLDPFAGAGTTGMVALRHHRSFVGLELNAEYVELARRRIIDDSPLINSVAETGA